MTFFKITACVYSVTWNDTCRSSSTRQLNDGRTTTNKINCVWGVCGQGNKSYLAVSSSGLHAGCRYNWKPQGISVMKPTKRSSAHHCSCEEDYTTNAFKISNVSMALLQPIHWITSTLLKNTTASYTLTLQRKTAPAQLLQDLNWNMLPSNTTPWKILSYF